MDMISFLYGIVASLAATLVSIVVYSFMRVRDHNNAIMRMGDDTNRDFRMTHEHFDKRIQTMKDDHSREFRMMHEHFEKLYETLRDDYSRDIRVLSDNIHNRVDDVERFSNERVDAAIKHLKIDLKMLEEHQNNTAHELYDEIQKVSDSKEQALYS
jgi:hypothetical protein